ncbi:MAG: hypothetical protein CFK52_12565 [Chloracidobacterium sp. CP2_5A]|nr:MAG: hypothetical protein CFK52_12565 [Chloracidobacterium sp. CP2_5A]
MESVLFKGATKCRLTLGLLLLESLPLEPLSSGLATASGGKRPVAPAKAAPSAPSAQSPGELERDMEARRQRDRDERSLRDLRRASQELEALTRKLAKRFDAVPPHSRPPLSSQDIDDFKQVEKLAKRVRDLQGGRGDGEDNRPLPGDFSAQLALLLELSAEVRQQSERASRHTVSAGIISRATRIARLSRSLRGG